MKTMDRILTAALELVNVQGAARVSTNAIADAADISVGNLYYHFKNKDDILLALFGRFEARIQPLLNPENCQVRLDQWVHWWQQWFQCVEAYPFLFHDQYYLQHSNDHFHFRYHQWVRHIEQAQRAMFRSLKDQGELVATQSDIGRLATVVTFMAVFWPDFEQLQHYRHPSTASESALDSAIGQMLGILLPYLKTPAQMQVEQWLKLQSTSSASGISRV